MAEAHQSRETRNEAEGGAGLLSALREIPHVTEVFRCFQKNINSVIKGKC